MLACSVILFGVTAFSMAQKTAVYDQPDAEFRDAQELFNKEKFGAAQQKYLNVIDMTKDGFNELTAQSRYYAAMCALELFNSDAEYHVVNYVRSHPEHIRVNAVWMHLARYHFRFKNYDEALEAFSRLDVYKLSEEEKHEYYFKSGYAHLMGGDLTSAKAALFEVKDKESRYASGATYYFAHISYTEKNYETALKSFQKLQKDEVYGRFTPYYITQIYYIQEKYDELLRVGPALLDSAISKRAPEIARMIGSACFKTGRWEEAIHYLHLYLDKSEGKAGRDDYYELAYAYYQRKDYVSASKWFQKVNTDKEDQLSQSALYHQADCLLKMGDRINALNYFNMTYQMGIDPVLTENALLNYAKLGYESGYNPYNEAVRSFQKYITEYPNSGRIDEAYEYLSELYVSTRNYKDAILSLESIKQRDLKLNRAYQKVCYFRGVELFNDQKLEEAMAHFDKALKNQVLPNVTAQATFWKGEALYRQSQWDQALLHYQTFLALPAAPGQAEYYPAHYNCGYCYFKKKDYAQALLAFRQYLSSAATADRKMLTDAYLRTADCYFMAKEYLTAIDHYDKAIAMKTTDNDYALYQKAVAYGPLGQFEQKANVLTDLVTRYPKSSYFDDALFEAGQTWQNLGNEQKAIAFYDRLITECKSSVLVSQAMLRKGLIFYNSGQDQKAMDVLKQVVADYRGTAESKEALIALRNVYVEMDKVQEFFTYIGSLGESLADDVQDSLTYIAVENRYMSNDCRSSVQGFTDYLTRFPEGQFAIDASFYRAECEYRDGNTDKALSGYQYVIGRPASKYLETSLLKAAEILFAQNNYHEALPLYQRLGDVAQYKNNITLSRQGIMRCQYKLVRYAEAIAAASVLLKTEKLPDELAVEAHMITGRSALAIDSLPLAVAEFTTVERMTKSEAAAEAKWSLGYIEHINGDYAGSEKTAFELINQVPSYDYWVAKAFILLADNYVKTGNNRQAKFTLQSIIDNYEGADLVKLAQGKLQMILEAEKQEELLKQQQQQSPPDEQFPQDEQINPGKF